MHERLSKAKAFIEAIYKMLIVLHDALYNLVLAFFKSENRKVNSRLTDWYMRKETSEHFRLLRMVFIWIVIPAIGSFFGEGNLLDIIFSPVFPARFKSYILKYYVSLNFPN